MAGGDGYGRGRGPTLDAAYQQATRQAAGGDRAASVQRAGYSRTAMGEFVVWVAMGVRYRPRPRSRPPPCSAQLQRPRRPPAGPLLPCRPSGPAMASDIPSWFNTKAKEESGRVIVACDGRRPDRGEAPADGLRSRKAALAEVMGGAPGSAAGIDVRPQAGARGTAYVLVSVRVIKK